MRTEVFGLRSLCCIVIALSALVLIGGVFSSANAEDPSFIEIQSIPTTAAWKWEPFTIGSDTYLMLGTDQSMFAVSGTPSKLYKWNGNSFVEFQSFTGASSWKHFVINNEHYLVGGGSDALKTYKWNGSAFADFQSISMGDYSWVNDCEFFTIGTNYYLAISIGQYDIAIYKWNSGFVHFQNLYLSDYIADVEFFSIGSDYYITGSLIFANIGYNYYSKIFKWNSSKFVEFQAILTNENASSSTGFAYAMAWKHFTIGTDHYLVVSHWDDVAGSKIYKWNGSNFVLFQSIPTKSNSGMEYYNIGTEHYLISANSPSKIYKWNGTNFVEFQSISITPASSMIGEWKHFMIGNDHYLAMANSMETSSQNISQNSKIYKWGILPTITAVNPNTGTTAGGTTVTITGTNFSTESASVTFGGVPATNVNVTSATSLTCITPAHAAGAVDVVVTVAGLSVTKAGGFNYVPPTTSAILTIDDAFAIQGKSNAAVTVALNNPGVAVSSMQFDILYNATAGIHANGSYNLSSRTSGFTASVTPSENGANSKVTVILYKLSGSIPTGSGAIIDILFNVDSSAAVGASTLSLGNCVLSDIAANRITSDCTDTAIFRVEPACSPTLGDINKDGSINILDLQVLINCIMGRGACNCCDLNNDSNNNIFDLQILINKIIAAVSTRSERDNGNNTLTLPAIQTSKGGTGSFGLGLNNQSAVASGEFVFTYDSTTGFGITDVRLTSRTAGFSTDMTTDTADPKNVKIKVLLYSMGKTVTPGTGDILAFTYTTSANAAGNTALTFSAGKNFLSDSGAQALNLTTQNGSVTIADAIPGNVNGDTKVDLADAILALQIVAGLNPPNVNLGADVNGDNKIGLEEVIYILQKVAGLR